MFDFHQETDTNQDGNVLALTLSGAIASDFHKRLNIEHCDFASSIAWGEENLCATVYSMKLDLALFLIRNKSKFNVDSVVVVSSKDVAVPEITLLDGQHIEPLEYITLLDGDEPQPADKGGSQDGHDDLSED